jgi:hypothetical protein
MAEATSELTAMALWTGDLRLGKVSRFSPISPAWGDGAIFQWFFPPQIFHNSNRLFPQTVRRLTAASSHKKTRFPGLWLASTVDRSEAHHLGNGLKIGVEVPMEGTAAVIDGGVGILQAVARQDTDDLGAGWYLISAFEQTGH